MLCAHTVPLLLMKGADKKRNKNHFFAMGDRVTFFGQACTVDQEEEKRVEGTEGDIAPKEEVREKEPPNTKRQRQVGLGDGWEMITPVKWKESPLDKGRKTFANIRKVQPE